MWVNWWRQKVIGVISWFNSIIFFVSSFSRICLVYNLNRNFYMKQVIKSYLCLTQCFMKCNKKSYAMIFRVKIHLHFYIILDTLFSSPLNRIYLFVFTPLIWTKHCFIIINNLLCLSSFFIFIYFFFVLLLFYIFTTFCVRTRKSTSETRKTRN